MFKIHEKRPWFGNLQRANSLVWTLKSEGIKSKYLLARLLVNEIPWRTFHSISYSILTQWLFFRPQPSFFAKGWLLIVDANYYPKTKPACPLLLQCAESQAESFHFQNKWGWYPSISSWMQSNWTMQKVCHWFMFERRKSTWKGKKPLWINQVEKLDSCGITGMARKTITTI